MESSREQSLKYIPFKGAKEEWEMWSAKFESKARKKGYLDILKGRTIVSVDDKNYPTDEEKVLIQLNAEWQRNHKFVPVETED